MISAHYIDGYIYTQYKYTCVLVYETVSHLNRFHVFMECSYNEHLYMFIQYMYRCTVWALVSHLGYFAGKHNCSYCDWAHWARPMSLSSPFSSSSGHSVVNNAAFTLVGVQPFSFIVVVYLSVCLTDGLTDIQSVTSSNHLPPCRPTSELLLSHIPYHWKNIDP